MVREIPGQLPHLSSHSSCSGCPGRPSPRTRWLNLQPGAPQPWVRPSCGCGRGGLGFLSLLAGPPMPSLPLSARLGLPLAVVGLIAGAADAVRLRWTCDDAFISFRYAQNLVAGRGLVFNEGEAVEGYTNFLWTVATALGMAAGVDPIDFTHAVGILAWLGVGLVLMVHARRARRWPVAAWVWAALPYGRHFATSGLETAAFSLALLAALGVASRAERREQALLAGLLATVAVMLRPEGGLALLAGPLLVARVSRGRLERVGAFAGVAAVLLVPWAAFKWLTYGALLPNTFVAKAGAGPQWSDGWHYLGLFFFSHPHLILGLLGLALAREASSTPSAARHRWENAVWAGVLVVYLLHIARVGGDFMYARFCIPLVPLLALGLERGLDIWRQRPTTHAAAVPAVGALLAVVTQLGPVPPQLFDDVDDGPRVVDERSWYPDEAVRLAEAHGATLARCAHVPDLRVVYFGTQAMLLYYSGLPYGLEPHVGLTDAELARLPPPPGARVGHGQKADTEMLRARRIDLALDYRLELPTTDITRVRFPGGLGGRLYIYRRPVVAGLRGCGAEIYDFERFLDLWVEQMPEAPDDQVARAYGNFKAFYFDHNDDPAREQPFRDRLGLGPADR